MASRPIGKRDLPPIRIESDGTKMHTTVTGPNGEDLSPYVTGISWDLGTGLAEVTLKLHPMRVDLHVREKPAEQEAPEVEEITPGFAMRHRNFAF